MSENGHHDHPTDGSANMKILSEDDHVVAFECHCGKEFIWAATSEARPECPQCGCSYYANTTLRLFVLIGIIGIIGRLFGGSPDEQSGDSE